MSSSGSSWRRHRWPLVVLLVLISLVGAISYRYIESRKTFRKAKAVLARVQSDADIHIGKVHQESTRDGRLEWVLDADSAQVENAAGVLLLKNVVLVFHAEDSRTVTIKAGQGTVYTGTQNIELTGDVRASYGEYRFSTDKICYEKKANRLASKAGVEITSDAFHLSADQFAFIVNSRKAVFTGNIRGILDGKQTF